MLKSIHIQNFRSIDNIFLDLGEPVIAFVGPNGVGKTNILQALEFCSYIWQGKSDVFSKQELGLLHHDKPVTMELVFQPEDYIHYTYSFQYNPNLYLEFPVTECLKRNEETVYILKSGMLTYKDDSERSINFGSSGSSSSLLISFLSTGSALHKELLLLRSYFSNLVYYSAKAEFEEHRMGATDHLISDEIFQKRIKDIMKNPGINSVQLRIIDSFINKPDVFYEISEILGENGLEIIKSIDVLSLESNKEKYYTINFHPSTRLAGSGKSFKFYGLSSGTWRCIKLIVNLLYNKMTCALIEQPEDSIHSGLLVKLMGVFSAYSHQTQIIITTHSEYVINYLKPESLRLVYSTNGVTEVQSINDSEIPRVRNFLKEDGNLSDYLSVIQP